MELNLAVTDDRLLIVPPSPPGICRGAEAADVDRSPACAFSGNESNEPELVVLPRVYASQLDGEAFLFWLMLHRQFIGEVKTDSVSDRISIT